MLCSGFDSVLSGSTCISLLLYHDFILSANVGDSRAVLYEKKQGIWKSTPLSMDHKPDNVLEAARVRKRGGRIEQSRLQVGQCLPSQVGTPYGPLRVWLKTKPLPGLAMTRSVGDTIAQEVGVIEEPEIKVFGSQTLPDEG